MHLVIINGAARPQSRSNTAMVIEAFKRGYEESGNTAEVWHLSDRRQWADAAKAFDANENILIALPLYVENIPGILLEFLEGLSPKTIPGTRMAFLIQGGFPEASQSRCCERYVETLPAQLGCTYAGTLLKGGMFGAGLLDERSRKKMLEPYERMGRQFARTRYFKKETVNRFAAPEYMPQSQIRIFNLFGRPVQRVYMGHIAKKLGCRERLDAMPYAFSPEQKSR